MFHLQLPSQWRYLRGHRRRRCRRSRSIGQPLQRGAQWHVKTWPRVSSLGVAPSTARQPLRAAAARELVAKRRRAALQMALATTMELAAKMAAGTVPQLTMISRYFPLHQSPIPQPLMKLVATKHTSAPLDLATGPAGLRWRVPTLSPDSPRPPRPPPPLPHSPRCHRRRLAAARHGPCGQMAAEWRLGSPACPQAAPAACIRTGSNSSRRLRCRSQRHWRRRPQRLWRHLLRRLWRSRPQWLRWSRPRRRLPHRHHQPPSHYHRLSRQALNFDPFHRLSPPLPATALQLLLPPHQRRRETRP